MQVEHQETSRGCLDLLLKIPLIRELTIFTIALLLQIADPNQEFTSYDSYDDWGTK